MYFLGFTRSISNVVKLSRVGVVAESFISPSIGLPYMPYAPVEGEH